MAIHLRGDYSPDLSGLDLAIRLKSDLVHSIAAAPMAQWSHHLARFVAELAGSGLTDKSAVVVLLAEARQELRALAGFAPQRRETEAAELLEVGSVQDWSIGEILARFEQVAANDLQAAAGGSNVSDVVARAVRVIENRYAEPITIAQVAAAVGRTPKHLGTIFRRQTGLTVHKYLTRVRLRHAIGLIRDGEKIEAVSLLVGYRSKKNFYRHFKLHTGITPAGYRTALMSGTRVREL
jgi:AraC-like DNA-binding protein